MHTTFDDLLSEVAYQFQTAPIVKPTHWQGRNISNRHDMQTYELLNHSSTVWLPDEDLDKYREDIQPDLPWADDHFRERVSGYPLNPGRQWALWRMGQGADGFRDPDGRFNHNYMERFWPKYARKVPASSIAYEHPLPTEGAHRGILYEYGDLADVVTLLSREPDTRQAYLPIWFPEDTGTVHGGRAPCSLGYHFIHRRGELHCVYYLRSCDAVNHLRNDLYFAVRMILWVLEQLRQKDPEWNDVGPGTLTTHITSLHCFRANFHELKNWMK